MMHELARRKRQNITANNGLKIPRDTKNASQILGELPWRPFVRRNRLDTFLGRALRIRTKKPGTV